MLFVRPATRDDAADIARIDVETWRTSYAGILPDKVLLGLTTGRLAGEWQSQLSRRPDDVRVAEWTGAGVIGFGSCGPIRNSVEGLAGEVHTLYVMPVEGSIAVVHLLIDNDAKPVDVVVGRPTGALRIVARDDEGKLSQGAVILRLNGDLIPLDMVGRRYEMAPGFDAAGERVLERLPPGAYEVWVVLGYGPLPAQPGARAGISAGEERVQVTVPKP